MTRRHYAYATCTEQELATVKQLARAAGLSVSDFVRRCINSYLVDQGDDVLLLTEFNRGDEDSPPVRWRRRVPSPAPRVSE